MQRIQKYFISSILSYNIIKKTALLCCTANQVGTDHKLHFQPKHPATAKLAAIINQNGCGTAGGWCRQFVSASYHLYYHIISVKRQICSVVPPTKSAHATSSVFTPKHQLGPNWQQSTTTKGCGTAEVWCRHLGSGPYHLYYHIISGKRHIFSVVQSTK